MRWNAEDVRDCESLDGNVTERMIRACMRVDMGKITEDNHEEFYMRCAMAKRVMGSVTMDNTTLSEVKRYIGLRTNVPTVSMAKFDKGLMQLLREEMERSVEYQKNREEE